MTKTLTIEFDGDFGLDVLDLEGRRCMGLTLGEAIEQIVHMHYEGTERFPMKTEADWNAEIAARRARRTK